MTSMTTPSADDLRELVEEESRGWWLYLITGAAWLVFGWIVLSSRSEITTVWAVAVFAGMLFLLFGVGEIATSFVAQSWRWWHLILGVVGIIAGITAFAWPEPTFLTLAAVIGWYLLFEGTLQIAAALARRDTVDVWWLFLIIGVVEVLIAFWAIGYPGRSVALLIVWVGASALAKGMTQIIGGFALHSVARDLSRR